MRINKYVTGNGCVHYWVPDLGDLAASEFGDTDAKDALKAKIKEKIEQLQNIDWNKVDDKTPTTL